MTVSQDGQEQTRSAGESASHRFDAAFTSVKDDRTRLLSLILIMAAVSLVVGGIAIYWLYRAAIEEQLERLIETAQSQARLMEAVARFDEIWSNDYPAGSVAATLSQVVDAHEHYNGFGETGEFTLARREGDMIIFLLSHRHDDLDNPRPIHFDTELAEPMHRALSGQSGTMAGLDYRGEVVLAAYEPVSELDLGIVAKIDLAEIREPFVTASLLGLGSGLLVILLGSVLFVRITNPVITRLQDSYGRAQQELSERRRAEEQVGLLMNSTAEAIYGLDLDGNCTWCNPACLDMLGYESSEKILGKNMHDLIHHSRLDGSPYPIRECRIYEAFLLGKGTHVDDEVIWRADGSSFHTEYWSYPVHRDGELIGSVVTFLDITDRKQAEEEKDNSLNLLRAVMVGTTDCIYVKDRDGRYLMVNESFVRLIGTPIEEIVGKSDVELFPTDIARKFTESDNRTMDSGEVWTFEEEVTTAGSSSPSFYSSTKAPYWDNHGNIMGIIGVSRDITERKQAEARLQKLSAVVEHSPASIMITDRNGSIEYVNPKFCAISGYDSDEVIGKTPRILKSGSAPKEHFELLWKTILAGKVWRGEFHNRSKNGDLYWENGSISPILNDQGEITHFVAVKEDNTARKKAENLVRQQEIELTHVSRLSTMGEMAAGLAHELNQPLGAISNYASNCLHLMEVEDMDGLQRDLAEIPAVVHRCGEIIRRIRSFVKRREPHRSTIKVPQLICDVLAFVEREALIHNIVICNESSEAPLSMIADRVQLEQVLLNLALNGIEAMVASEREEKILTVKAVRKGANEVEFSVQDTGNGISPDILERVCEAFVTTKSDGLGMGLAICNTIVQAHHGLLDISSSSNQGTLVRFSIPMGMTRDE